MLSKYEMSSHIPKHGFMSNYLVWHQHGEVRAATPVESDGSYDEVEANLIFNNATHKVIKFAFKHACCISIVSYYMQMNLLHFCTHVLKLLIFYFDMQM
jgi:hypothetical protein